MKKTIKFFTAAVVMLAFTATAFGQLSATANAGARIIAPLAIALNTDLHFGTIMKGALASTVEITPAGVRTVLTGNATLSALAPAATAARFTITGEPTLSYSITLPASTSITGPGPAMTVNVFTGDVVSPNTIPAGGSQILNVGAVLNVATGATQTSGTYTGTFNVSVNYN
jgi:hypothetical protein